MPTTFRPYAPDQALLLPVSLREWLPEDHIAYFISEVVDELDLSTFYAPYEGDGRRKMPYEPSMMLKVLITGTSAGYFRLGSLRASLRRMWRFGCWRRGIFRSTGRCASAGQREQTQGDELSADAAGRAAQPDGVLADAGYRKEDDFDALEQRGIDAYVSVRREGKDAGDIDADTYPATHRMVEKLSTPDGRERYRDRKQIVEAANGWIKHVMGFRRFSIRGLTGAAGEWDLVCLATSLRRMRPLIEFG